MLKVTVEKIDALTGKRTTLHMISITNDGTGNRTRGHYDVLLHTPGRQLFNARIENHHRDDGALWLVMNALEVLTLAKEGKL